jgi:hypothetical protein
MRWPSAADENALLEPLRAGQPLAVHDIVTIYLPLLVDYLQQKYPWLDDHLLTTAAEDALLNFLRRPASFDPQRSSFRQFLCMAAQADLKNLLEKERRARRAISLESVAEPSMIRNDQQDADISWEHPRLKSEIEILNDQERTVLELMRDGVRSTLQCAKKLGLMHLDEHEQTMEVKRLKDRVKRRLSRAVVQRT